MRSILFLWGFLLYVGSGLMAVFFFGSGHWELGIVALIVLTGLFYLVNEKVLD